jgi:hypothetical protein
MVVAVAVEEAVELLSPHSPPWRSLSTRSPLARLEPLSPKEGPEPPSLVARTPCQVEKHHHRRHHHSWRR